MSHTYSSNRLHIVFSTKERRRIIAPAFQPRLWSYMAEVAKNRGIPILAVGGHDDHAHVLLVLPPTMLLAKCVQAIKGISSKWMTDNGHRGFAWQQGYAAFSVSASQTTAVVEYIRTQREHHKRHSFEAEFLSLLRKHGIQYDPKYVFG